MKLIIGGVYQGKLAYAVENYLIEKKDFVNGEELDSIDWEKSKDCPKGIYNLHSYIKKALQHKENPMEEIKSLLCYNHEIVLITNEIGYGIVPMEATEREYREITGRICCYLAKEAEEVVRVTCGIGRKIKG